MASTSSSSSSSSISSYLSGNRMGGLISGLDTESLVKSMAANTKNRLNTKKQKLQTLQWKQENYRSIISKISDFQTKYLSVTASGSVKSNANMNKYVAKSSDSKVVASAISTAIPATYHINKATAASAASIASEGSVSADKVSLDFSANEKGKEYKVNMTLDGTKLEVTFKGGADADASKANFLEAVNNTFKNIKGSGQEFKFNDGTSDLVFDDAGDGIYHTFDVGYNKEAVGLANTTSSRMSYSSHLGDIAFSKDLKADSDGNYKMSINGVDFKFNKDTTISGMLSQINNSAAGVKMTFSSITQSFSLESKTTGTAGSISITQDGTNLANVLFNTDKDLSQEIRGVNGTISVSTDGVNYKTYTSASNSYTFDGTTIDITSIGNFEATGDVEEITVATSRDTSSIKDTVVKFIESYNELLSDLYGTVNTSRPKKNGSYYDPLTEEQEDEMEQSDIEKWNEQAKQGLLYHDNYTTKFLSNIRTAMTTSVDGFSLADMGITVSSTLSDYGKLIIDEQKLDASIESYGDQIANFFTNTTDGLAAKVSNVVDSAVSKDPKKTGYLTQLAGIENTSTAEKSTLYSQISSLQRLISSLEDRYENELERYWNQFSNLESYMNQMQNQSSSLFGSNQ